jgi:hypothetical protein
MTRTWIKICMSMTRVVDADVAIESSRNNDGGWEVRHG